MKTKKNTVTQAATDKTAESQRTIYRREARERLIRAACELGLQAFKLRKSLGKHPKGKEAALAVQLTYLINEVLDYSRETVRSK